MSSSGVLNSVDFVADSYGKDEADLIHQIFIKWWLRLPDQVYGDSHAWNVWLDGDVGVSDSNGVYYDSYGRFIFFGR